MMSQREAIRHHLETFGPISLRVAYEEYGCSRLPARIWELKRQGMKIEKTMITIFTKQGKKMVAAYRMVE